MGHGQSLPSEEGRIITSGDVAKVRWISACPMSKQWSDLENSSRVLKPKQEFAKSCNFCPLNNNDFFIFIQ